MGYFINHDDYEPEDPSYFLCEKHDVPDLVRKAQKESEDILNELKHYATGDIGICIKPYQYAYGWSIGADLTVNGEVVRSETCCEMIFIDLNMIMLNAMIRNGFPSGGNANGK